MFSGFTFSIGAHSIYEEVEGFSPLWFPQGKFFVHVILSDKILRSYCLNDKNLTLSREFLPTPTVEGVSSIINVGPCMF